MVVVELQADDGSTVHRLPDPNGGTFDAAGYFDRFVQAWPEHNPSLSGLVLEGTSTLGTDDMTPLMTSRRACRWRRMVQSDVVCSG